MKQDLFNLNDEKHPVRSAREYVVIPSLPDKLKPLLDIANNFWWVWNSEAVELFRRMDRQMWEESYHNPIRLLGALSQDRLQELARDNGFLSHLENMQNDLKRYLELTTWYEREFPRHKNCTIAYFSTEFAIHECLPIYSGGLGVLSGDHLKSASDMGLPLVGVGLLYRYGYFKQYLNFDGWQQEEYVENHFSRMPVQRVRDDKGNQLKIFVESPGPSGKVYARVWKIQVGRVPLYLLDTDIEENTPDDREITSQLYGGDRDMRIRQEIMLGIGGMRVLKALGIDPAVIHINEGHSAFLILERIRMLMDEHKLGFDEAREIVRSSSVFTTHTPVPAGNEVFTMDLIEKYISHIYKKQGVNAGEFIALGKENPEELNDNFSMTVLALRMSSHANGVSRLHGTISRKIWSGLWPGMPRNEIPITSVTNGIHTNTWISYEMAGLFDRYIGSVWKDEPADQTIWQRVEDIPDTELWRSHERRRERLVSFARKRLKDQLIRRGASAKEIDYADEVLDPEALTIGFARRFAAYKRGNLIFRDIGRIKNILTQKDRPVQLIIAGKAHPADNVGKELIKAIIHLTRDPELRNRIVFIEDYDMNVAHYLVQGADVWMNNPRRPAEASGTSGMKAAVNGVLNLSVLDGWWCEGYNGKNGWIVGSGEEYSDWEYQDEVESKALYDIMEKDIVPQFYHRGNDGLPREWIRMMKTSMQTICPSFNTNRMIEEYTRNCYRPADLGREKFSEHGYAVARKMAQWKKFIQKNWANIKIMSVSDNLTNDVSLGDTFTVSAKIKLGAVLPRDVAVQVYWGYLDSKQRMNRTKVNDMKIVESGSDGVYLYEGAITGDRVGHCGFVVRILPQYEDQVLYLPGMITWQ
jgi:starch phosphorylase